MGFVLSILFWVAVAVLAFKLWVKLTTGWCRSNVCLIGKTAIITGANTGIGYEAAEDFAKRGARVILACRDPTRGQNAVEKIIKATDNKNVVFKQLDLSSFKSVTEFAGDVNKTEERLDILLNNAGMGGKGFLRADNGFLLLMQTNYFGHFLLTNLLLDLLKKTQNSRIINVSSLAAKWAKDFDINQLNKFGKDDRNHFQVYARSKLCNLLFTIELANRLKGTSVTTYSLHPGVVLTDIFRKMPPFMKMMTETIISWFMKNSLEGAQTSIYCSVQKGIENYTGEHFEDCHFISRYKTAQDPDLPKQLWKVTEELISKVK
ncbi:unnamed protein product [Ceutorhynchus assimilis]|uniref:Uncharacterized protein n=1 Tax=Ceutorhynchus assimilis TaxID=467358 RepID=A0A9N9QK42_9CUCU|nr:unnamed protein product [Ceutorhynchus assimilis]